jgi:putative inorganic carbon (hco3(-)) transporter
VIAAEQRRFLPQRVAVGAAIGLVAVASALAVSVRPVPVVAALLLAVVAIVLLGRPDAAVAVMVVSFYFEGYLTSATSFATPAKAIGVLAVVSWLVAWLVRGRPVVGAPQMWFLAALGIWVVTILPVAVDQRSALIAVSRYGMFFVLFFLIVQSVAGDRRRLELLVDVAVAAAAISAAIGLVAFLRGHVGRASGPLPGPDDFGFLLGSTLPLAVWRLRRSTTRLEQVLSVAAVSVLFATILATLSRGALVALAAAGLWTIVTGRVHLRRAVLVLFVGVLVAGGAYTFARAQVSSAVSSKQDVAAQNVHARLYYWKIALLEFQASPLLGVGPGNYTDRFPEFGLPYSFGIGVQTTHNTYLNMLSELGLPGALLFAGYLGSSMWVLSRRFPGDRRRDELQVALAAGFIIAMVGAIFLTEEFYPPLWMLPAMGVLATGRGPTGARGSSRL